MIDTYNRGSSSSQYAPKKGKSLLDVHPTPQVANDAVCVVMLFCEIPSLLERGTSGASKAIIVLVELSESSYSLPHDETQFNSIMDNICEEDENDEDSPPLRGEEGQFQKLSTRCSSYDISLLSALSLCCWCHVKKVRGHHGS